ncbi:MAG TPA: acyl-CoA dehydratase activase-related protein, partial [Rectinemataceae bacterium]|nr:acyl-CoA dehydratase activase-related protein [Rectinemataceae bacterium]
MRLARRLGIDVGSTTVKLALLGEGGSVLFGRYERHRSDVSTTLSRLLEEASAALGALGRDVRATVTGSAGIGTAERLGLPFVQEVMACSRAVERLLPGAEVAVELGGEDAKITYFGDRLEQRRNGSCAGGTGAFIDQMAVLLGTDPAGLDALASGATCIYPIAARCGVFAKADVQPLVNEGARREDIAASVLQAVVNQSISGLACGRPIRGRVAFLGGPLHFLPELRRRFVQTLGLKAEEILVPEDGRLFVALGAALHARESSPELPCSLAELASRSRASKPVGEAPRMPPLFSSPPERAEFQARHGASSLPLGEIGEAAGPVFLGIDAGSTTTKLALIDGEARLLHSFYAPNGGHPLSVLSEALGRLYAALPAAAWIGRSCATGYGESLVKAALGADEGEVETVAHCRAAEALLPGVESVLDIGGQDMKFIRVKDGVIASVLLNEACSSGCGSFLETFAHSLGYGSAEFAALALESASPVDLGSRCTVFMNSRVKQAQKEGATPADIAAGLAYSVVRNALQKVIRLKRPEDVGSRVVVQGGTFASEAVLRCFELVSGARAMRPAQTGLMGAYGAALVARSHWREGARSTMAGRAELGGFGYSTESRRCPGCANACLLTVTSFGSGARPHVGGNRCERGATLAIAECGAAHTITDRGPGGPRRAPADAAPIVGAAPTVGAATFAGAATKVGAAAAAARSAPAPTEVPFEALPPDLFAWKHGRIFAGEALPPERASRGRLGIPRVLNLYENYPFWQGLLTSLGFSVALSPRSSKSLAERGMDTIPSESICYPAKLAHGHGASLAVSGSGLVFYPCVPRERRFVAGSDNRFNCPVVTSYPEVLLNNIEAFRDGSMPYLNPFLPIDSRSRLAARIVEEFATWEVTPREAKAAVEAAHAAQEAYGAELRARGEAALDWVSRRGAHGIVLAGRPYHVDPEVHHGIPGIITGLGMAVLSEDSICHLGRVERPLRVVDQWAYHSRLYAAASFVSGRDELDLVQLVSFGCGLDAVTSDQVEEILARRGRIYTAIKIDEHANLGAARIRMRSLAAAIADREAAGRRATAPAPLPGRRSFSKAMRAEYSILAPQMSPIHFRLVEAAFRASGFRLEILPVAGREELDEGLRAVNNDACFPSILVTGQLMAALRSGRYDLDRTALLVSQTGGGCRASNYIAFIRKALADSGLERLPVISLNALGMESHPGFRLSP